MGIDCYGWVEVNDPSTPGAISRNPYWWSGVVRIDDIIVRNYKVYGYFFGVRNQFDMALASHRGLPVQLSQEVIRTLEARFDPTDMPPGATWVTWSEIASSDWQARLELPREWGLLFSLMGQVAHFYDGERVRLVVWFDDGPGVDP